MGTWGYQPLDNDAALEIQYIWENYVEQYSKEYHWSEEDIVDYFVKKRWGDAVNCGDNITNSEIIAVVEIFILNKLKITRSLKKIAQDAINRELVEEELKSWKNPDKRRKILLEILKSIGGKTKRPKKIMLFNDPSIEFKNRAIAERELMKLTGFGKKLMFSFDIFNHKDLARDLPNFIKTLNRFVHHGIWEKDSNLSIEAQSQRLMMIAYYLGMSLGYSDDKIRRLIKDAKWENNNNT